MPEGFPTRSDINLAVQPQKMSGYRLRKQKDCTIYKKKVKALISCVVTTQLICAPAYHNAKSRISHDASHFVCDGISFYSILDLQAEKTNKNKQTYKYMYKYI